MVLMKQQFLVFDAHSNEIIAFDRKRSKVVRLQDGRFTDITDDCKKIYERELKKERHPNGKKLGGLWYECLKGLCDRVSACIWTSNVMVETDNQKEFDEVLLNKQRKQIELMLTICNDKQEKLQNDKQYYTYEFSNC